MDETKLRVKKGWVYAWSSVKVGSNKLLALEASYGDSMLNVLTLLNKALKQCLNKPKVIVDRGYMVSMGIKNIRNNALIPSFVVGFL